MAPIGLLRKRIAVAKVTGVQATTRVSVFDPHAADFGLALKHGVGNAQARKMPGRHQARHARPNDCHLKIGGQSQPGRAALTHRRAQPELVQKQIGHRGIHTTGDETHGRLQLRGGQTGRRSLSLCMPM